MGSALSASLEFREYMNLSVTPSRLLNSANIAIGAIFVGRPPLLPPGGGGGSLPGPLILGLSTKYEAGKAFYHMT